MQHFEHGSCLDAHNTFTSRRTSGASDAAKSARLAYRPPGCRVLAGVSAESRSDRSWSSGTASTNAGACRRKRGQKRSTSRLRSTRCSVASNHASAQLPSWRCKTSRMLQYTWTTSYIESDVLRDRPGQRRRWQAGRGSGGTRSPGCRVASGAPRVRRLGTPRPGSCPLRPLWQTCQRTPPPRGLALPHAWTRSDFRACPPPGLAAAACCAHAFNDLCHLKELHRSSLPAQDSSSPRKARPCIWLAKQQAAPGHRVQKVGGCGVQQMGAARAALPNSHGSDVTSDRPRSAIQDPAAAQPHSRLVGLACS